jgi:hypothetical protein
MGFMQLKFSIASVNKAAKKLQEEIEEMLLKSGLTAEQVETLCLKATLKAKSARKGKYTNMGGYPPEDQLYDDAIRLVYALDEKEELDSLLEETQEEKQVSEPELEDAYHVADSIQFAGSPKQIKWAQDIALNNLQAIALSDMAFNQFPKSAKWWIDNRENILEALKKHNAG